jgi:hypothetical protein
VRESCDGLGLPLQSQALRRPSEAPYRPGASCTAIFVVHCHYVEARIIHQYQFCNRKHSMMGHRTSELFRVFVAQQFSSPIRHQAFWWMDFWYFEVHALLGRTLEIVGGLDFLVYAATLFNKFGAELFIS